MVIAGLLLIALICLVVGLVLPNAAWLIASVIASVGAGYLVLRVIRAARPAAAHAGAPGVLDDALGSSDPTDTFTGTGAVAAPADHGDDAAVAGERQAADPGVTIMDASAGAGADDVWVIDGRPRYHVATCAIIQGQDAEPIPFEQATEDGFMPCSLCEPTAVRAAGRSAEG